MTVFNPNVVKFERIERSRAQHLSRVLRALTALVCALGTGIGIVNFGRVALPFRLYRNPLPRVLTSASPYILRPRRLSYGLSVMPKVINHRVAERQRILAERVLQHSVIAMPACSRCARARLLCRVSINSTRCARCIQEHRGCDIALNPVECESVCSFVCL